MASDKRTILSGKRARNRRKKASLRAANQPLVTPPTPECDSDEDAKLQRQKLVDSSSGSDNTTSQSENEEEEEDESLVFVCRPTMPNFCSVFMPRSEEAVDSACSHKTRDLLDCKTFTTSVPSFRETCEGFVAYTIELTTFDEPRHTFRMERRFSEFVASDEESKTPSGDKPELEDDFQWELPARTWFRVTQASALEERRAQLELSLETLLLHHHRRMCNLPVLRDFLMLDIFGVQVVEHKSLEIAHCE
ncbi:hypothetical protein BBO99_00006780 [Phytophthora kernoviae]|uniref:PX domain-containing protein n=2 Tax=Phytophthora kernoviae TaxID=325452 RepID=A0A3R7JXF9_9STRA|nr:hypothetical protein G195_008276 [Phytophthora kernoviae 00238/432]KAG2515401.1 hypothetical protein JM18_006118 [Phytophthora kernoviae]KAG2519435.1 hypothetical protein JM16_006331 [Phytophthora kernoviae]RLN31549.1 hypothetical protein BBI17_006776 [Phytophthora kernoviae]RLN77405.1 hypothetical protein BBO99_00006780 [Phytophthora kernoviae]